MIAALIRWSLRHRGAVLWASALLAVLGLLALERTRVDALPDLSDLQVIVQTEFPGQSPQVVEDQVTWPLSSALASLPRARAVRGFSAFGVSFVYVIFEQDTELYWARSRVSEALARALPRLPAGVQPALGPEASSVGWVYQYALVDRGGRHELHELRALQDWWLKPELQSLPGVAEVATVGGAARQYQVVVDPDRLNLDGLMVMEVIERIRQGNQQAGGSSVELAEADYMIQANGLIRGLEDLRALALDATGDGAPIQLGNVAEVGVGPAPRPGIAELDGEGEVVGGIVVMRHGENARELITRVRQRLAELRAALPEGVEVVTVYDRTPLIEGTLASLRSDLLIEFLVVTAVCLAFLLHGRASLVVVLSLPLGVLAALLVMERQGITANVMSLGGIAVAIGAMVDAAIVMIENVHKRLEAGEEGLSREALIERAACEVGPALFFSLAVITLSFLPLLALEGEAGRLFSPLVYTKTYAMAAATILAVTLVPVLVALLVRGRLRPEGANPLNRLLAALYAPLLRAALARPALVVLLATAVALSALWPLARLGTEFMPELDEGDLLYMPTTLPGLGVGKAAQLLQQTDRAIAAVPEVARVFGKVGRAQTATDPAPMNMIETLVQLRPREQWRPGVTLEHIRAELDAAVRLPGLANAWVGPIRARLDMLSTGFRTPVGIKLSGPDPLRIAELTQAVEARLRALPGTRSVFAERSQGGRYVMIDLDQRRLARYGLRVEDVQSVISMGVGGMPVAETLEGRERYAITVRFPRALRDSPERLERLPLLNPAGSRLTLGDVATVRIARGPDMIRSENGRPSGWVHVQPEDGDIEGYVQRARAALVEDVPLPPGYTLAWSGRYEHLREARERLMLLTPAVLVAILALLYGYFRRTLPVLLVLGGLPLALAGGLWLVWLMGMQLSVAVLVGLLALAGVAVETGVVMLVFLQNAWAAREAKAAAEGRRPSRADLDEAVQEGALLRLRPKLMTVAAIVGGLAPLLLSRGVGAEVMRPIAAPMVGGMLTAAALTLLLIPALFRVWQARALEGR